MLIMQRNLYKGPSGYTGLKNILSCLDLKVTLTFFHTLTLITLGVESSLACKQYYILL